MPWLRSGDNAATHPIVMRVASLVLSVTESVLERDVALNEVFGFAMRCALQSAGHTTDYVIEEGTAWLIGGARTPRLLELAIQAGYLTRKRVRGQSIYLLIDDPEFIHMRTRKELERDRARKADNSNPALTVPVRLRDGDECRYCGVAVNWNDRKGGRGATYDARGGHPAKISTMVVACNACNGGRGDDPNADDRYPLRPEPTTPIYGPRTAEFLENAGYRVEVTEGLRPGSRPGHARSDSAASGITRKPTTSRAPVTSAWRPTSRATGPPGSADIEHPESGFAGTGRDRAGLGLGPGVGRDAGAAQRRRRSRRGGRR